MSEDSFRSNVEDIQKEKKASQSQNENIDD